MSKKKIFKSTRSTKTMSIRATRKTVKLLKTIPWGKRDRVIYALLKENIKRIAKLAA